MFSQLSELMLQFPLTIFQLANGFLASKCYALNLEDFCFHIFTSSLLNQHDTLRKPGTLPTYCPTQAVQVEYLRFRASLEYSA
jgi:hypothetical protein